MTLDEAVRRFEGLFDAVSERIGFPDDSGDWSRAPTGDRYISMTNGGPKEEGAPFSCSSPTPDLAIIDWSVAATAYASGKSILHWRRRPEVTSIDPRVKPARYVVCSRMFAQ